MQSSSPLIVGLKEKIRYQNNAILSTAMVKWQHLPDRLSLGEGVGKRRGELGRVKVPSSTVLKRTQDSKGWGRTNEIQTQVLEVKDASVLWPAGTFFSSTGELRSNQHENLQTLSLLI